MCVSAAVLANHVCSITQHLLLNRCAPSQVAAMKRIFDDLYNKVAASEVAASEKRKRIVASEERNGTARCSRDTGPVFTAVTANHSTSEARDNARTDEGEPDTDQRGRDTLSPLDKFVRCWDAMHEEKSGWLQHTLPDVPAAYLDRLDAVHHGDIPDSVYLKLRAEPWTLPELPSPSLSDSPE